MRLYTGTISADFISDKSIYLSVHLTSLRVQREVLFLLYVPEDAWLSDSTMTFE